MVRNAPSLALINGSIYPFAPPGRASAVLERDGFVEALGNDSDILRMCDTSTLVLDLHGATVLPGLATYGASLTPRAGEAPEVSLETKLDTLAKFGVTLAEVDVTPDDPVIARLCELDAAEKLPIRVAMRVRIGSISDVAEVAANFQDIPPEASKGGLLSLGPLKIVLDGYLENRTAALRTDYSDDPGNRGMLLMGYEGLCAALQAAELASWRTAIHAYGDAAIEVAISAIETALPDESARRSHRIVHCAAGSEEQYHRIADMGVPVEICPSRLGTDWRLILSRLGNERARTVFAWKTMLRLGIRLCAGCDEVDAPSPFAGMAAVLLRRDEDGNPREGWMPSESLDRPEALWLYTGGAADVQGVSDSRGTLEPGKAADITVLQKNPFHADVEELGAMEAGITIVGGRIGRIV